MIQINWATFIDSLFLPITDTKLVKLGFERKVLKE